MLETSATIARQYIDAVSTFEALEEAQEEAEYLGKKMRRYWTSFAKDGEPKGWPRWPLYREGLLLRLDVPLGLLPDLYEERCGALEVLGLL